MNYTCTLHVLPVLPAHELVIWYFAGQIDITYFITWFIFLQIVLSRTAHFAPFKKGNCTKALFSSHPVNAKMQNFAKESYSFEVLNEVNLQNFLHRWAVNRETNLMSLLNPCCNSDATVTSTNYWLTMD